MAWLFQSYMLLTLSSRDYTFFDPKRKAGQTDLCTYLPMICSRRERGEPKTSTEYYKWIRKAQ